MSRTMKESRSHSSPKKNFLVLVYKVVARIPQGKTMTYGQVAKKAGFPGAARAVGTAMKHNLDPRKIPCHRVVRADGQIGAYAFGGTKAKMARLKKEGVTMNSHGRLLK